MKSIVYIDICPNLLLFTLLQIILTFTVLTLQTLVSKLKLLFGIVVLISAP